MQLSRQSRAYNMNSDTISLTLKTRPIRAVFLARDGDDILQAVRLYTHLWGGAANALLPLPGSENAVEWFVRAVQRFDPDVLLTSVTEIPASLGRVLNDLPYPIASVSAEQIDGHVGGAEPFRFHGGAATHPVAVLESRFPVPVSAPSNVRIPEPSESYNFALAMHCGLPSDAYARYLREHLGGRILRTPHGIEELLKVLLISARRLTPASLSLHSTRISRTMNLFDESPMRMMESGRVDSPRTLFLFLASGNEIDTACAFWNARRLSTSENKYLVPMELFRQSIGPCLELLGLPGSYDALMIFASIPSAEALRLHAEIQQYTAKPAPNMPVAVYHRAFVSDMLKGGVYWGHPVSSTRIVSADASLLFVPPSPPGHRHADSVFGFDAEIQFATGIKLSLPRTSLTTRLLLNTPERLRRARENKRGIGEMWLNRSRGVRARSDGLSGSISPGKEVLVHLHPDDVLIRESLLHRGIRIRPNKHTRYARGFIHRFGSVEDTLALISAGGGHILGAFAQHRAEEGGISCQQLRSYLETRAGCGTSEAGNLIREHLPALLRAGLVRRGVSLKCPLCDLKEWYSISALTEFVECAGCAESFQLYRDGVQFSYVANELARRFVNQGGNAVLMTASALRQIDRSAALEFGGDLLRQEDTQNFAEVDLFWLVRDHLIPVECKRCGVVDETQISKIVEALRKTIAAAQELDARIVLLGVLANEVEPTLFDMLRAVAESAKEDGIGVHLILNDRFHPWCSVEDNDPAEIDVGRMLGEDGVSHHECVYSEGNHVGQIAPSYGMGLLSGPEELETLSAWEADMML